MENQLIKCACGCGREFYQFDNKGRSRKYVSGHNPQPIDPNKWEKIGCLWCGKIFSARKVYHRKFCNRSHKSKFLGNTIFKTEEYRISQRYLSLANGNKPPLHKGENHWHWKGGITPASKKKRSTAEYKAWRLGVYRKDRFKCQDCGSIGKNLEAHHIKPWVQYPELRFEIDNGKTVCSTCHKKYPRGNKIYAKGA